MSRYIDADALMQEIMKIRASLQMLDNTQSADKMLHGLRMVEMKVENAPTIEPKRGEWKVRGNPKRNLWECSLCGCTIYSESESGRNKFHKWCGRCGADMRGSEKE